MRWIKASERLPEDHAKGYYLRFITPGSFHCLAVGLFCKNELNETVVKFYSGTNGECGPDEIEWLDESDDPIPPTEENAIREEAERLSARVRELEKHLQHIYDMYGNEWTEYAREWTEKALKGTNSSHI